MDGDNDFAPLKVDETDKKAETTYDTAITPFVPDFALASSSFASFWAGMVQPENSLQQASTPTAPLTADRPILASLKSIVSTWVDPTATIPQATSKITASTAGTAVGVVVGPSDSSTVIPCVPKKTDSNANEQSKLEEDGHRYRLLKSMARVLLHWLSVTVETKESPTCKDILTPDRMVSGNGDLIVIDSPFRPLTVDWQWKDVRNELAQAFRRGCISVNPERAFVRAMVCLRRHKSVEEFQKQQELQTLFDTRLKRRAVTQFYTTVHQEKELEWRLSQIDYLCLRKLFFKEWGLIDVRSVEEVASELNAKDPASTSSNKYYAPCILFATETKLKPPAFFTSSERMDYYFMCWESLSLEVQLKYEQKWMQLDIAHATRCKKEHRKMILEKMSIVFVEPRQNHWPTPALITRAELGKLGISFESGLACTNQAIHSLHQLGYVVPFDQFKNVQWMAWKNIVSGTGFSYAKWVTQYIRCAINDPDFCFVFKTWLDQLYKLCAKDGAVLSPVQKANPTPPSSLVANDKWKRSRDRSLPQTQQAKYDDGAEAESPQVRNMQHQRAQEEEERRRLYEITHNIEIIGHCAWRHSCFRLHPHKIRSTDPHVLIQCSLGCHLWLHFSCWRSLRHQYESKNGYAKVQELGPCVTSDCAGRLSWLETIDPDAHPSHHLLFGSPRAAVGATATAAVSAGTDGCVAAPSPCNHSNIAHLKDTRKITDIAVVSAVATSPAAARAIKTNSAHILKSPCASALNPAVEQKSIPQETPAQPPSLQSQSQPPPVLRPLRLDQTLATLVPKSLPPPFGRVRQSKTSHKKTNKTNAAVLHLDEFAKLANSLDPPPKYSVQSLAVAVPLPTAAPSLPFPVLSDNRDTKHSLPKQESVLKATIPVPIIDSTPKMDSQGILALQKKLHVHRVPSAVVHKDGLYMLHILSSYKNIVKSNLDPAQIPFVHFMEPNSKQVTNLDACGTDAQGTSDHTATSVVLHSIKAEQNHIAKVDASRAAQCTREKSLISTPKQVMYLSLFQTSAEDSKSTDESTWEEA